MEAVVVLTTSKVRLMKSTGDFNQRQTAGWSRLSTTQQLTARGIAILLASVVLAGALGTARRTEQDKPMRFSGAMSLATLNFGNGKEAVVEVTDVLAEFESKRTRKLLEYSARFDVDVDLAALVYDIALQERIDPELGFRVVYAESRFNSRAVSSAGAFGLAQVMPTTARIFDPDLANEDLFDSEINLRIGFRYLRAMVDKYGGDLSLGLLAYNRGPTRLQTLIDGGLDPRNGYASSVLEGYRPSEAGTEAAANER